jgi:Type II secretion system (T2SS), protein G
MRRAAAFLTAAFMLAIVSSPSVRADLSQKDVRKVIQTMGGWSLPSDAVRIISVSSDNAEGAEVSAQIQAVFRLRLHDRRWELREVRTGPDRWERLDVMARALGGDLRSGSCDKPSQFVRAKSATELTAKRARCLVANLLGVELPSDDVRIKEISPFGLSLGPESAALVVALVRIDLRLARDAKNWRVAEFKSGNRDWVNVAALPSSIDQIKRADATEELSTVARALGEFRRDRGAFVVSDKESVLIDHLSPRYLPRVIRVDPWHRPYHYEGQPDRYSLRSAGPDGKPNTADDVVISGP